jgi:diaminopimelate dehydrogenase
MPEQKKAIIVGFGNIGRACRDLIKSGDPIFSDFDLAGIISRNPERVAKDKTTAGIPIFDLSDEDAWKAAGADVALLCGGSKNDLFGDEKEVTEILEDCQRFNDIVAKGGKSLLELGQGPYFAQHFGVTLDTFDTHGRIEMYDAVLNSVSERSGNLAVLSTGWDPGTLSERRMEFFAYAQGDMASYFYGLKPKGGKSMGHSNALLTVDGVKRGIQYTHAIPELIEVARRGETLPEGKTVTRECVVVLKNDTLEERTRVEKEIKTMPGYYEGYKTTVEFVTDSTFDLNHADSKQHDGIVIATGKVGGYDARHEFACEYESNAHGTAGIMLATARGAYRLRKDGKTGSCILPEIPILYRHPSSRKEILKSGFM